VKIDYFPETDTLYIELARRPSSESQEIAEGVVVDYDSNGQIVGLGIDQASKILSLEELELNQLPIRTQKISA
jgi:uncharacterized protein YuzE